MAARGPEHVYVYYRLAGDPAAARAAVAALLADVEARTGVARPPARTPRRRRARGWRSTSRSCDRRPSCACSRAQCAGTASRAHAVDARRAIERFAAAGIAARALRPRGGADETPHMCLAVVALGAHPRYPLVVAANRDEFHRARRPHRRSGGAEGWFAGRDLEAGGTWLGVTPHGPLGAAHQRARAGAPRSRARRRAARWCRRSSPRRRAPRPRRRDDRRGGDAVNGFNLLAGDASAAHWASNRAPTRRAR